MGNFWLKVKVWTKAIVAAIVTVYALFFVYNNWADATVWWWFNKPPFKSSTVVLIVIAFLAGLITAVLIRTTLGTLRQMRDLRSRSRTDRIERELADMKQKASRLQTKPSAIAETVSPPIDPTDSI